MRKCSLDHVRIYVSLAKALGSGQHETYLSSLLFYQDANRSIDNSGNCSQMVIKMSGCNDHSVLSLSVCDSSSASQLSFPGTCAALIYVWPYSRTKYLVLEHFNLDVFPLNVFIYEQIVVIHVHSYMCIADSFTRSVRT